jgi:hypothetical protein
MNIAQYSFELQDYKNITLSVSNRNIIRDALEMYRNEMTKKLYSDVESNFTTEYYDIELLEIDEVIEILGIEE